MPQATPQIYKVFAAFTAGLAVAPCAVLYVSYKIATGVAYFPWQPIKFAAVCSTMCVVTIVGSYVHYALGDESHQQIDNVEAPETNCTNNARPSESKDAADQLNWLSVVRHLLPRHVDDPESGDDEDSSLLSPGEGDSYFSQSMGSNGQIKGELTLFEGDSSPSLDFSDRISLVGALDGDSHGCASESDEHESLMSPSKLDIDDLSLVTSSDNLVMAVANQDVTKKDLLLANNTKETKTIESGNEQPKQEKVKEQVQEHPNIDCCDNNSEKDHMKNSIMAEPAEVTIAGPDLKDGLTHTSSELGGGSDKLLLDDSYVFLEIVEEEVTLS